MDFRRLLSIQMGSRMRKIPLFHSRFDAVHRDGLSLRLADRLLIRKYGSDMEDSSFRNFTDIAALLRGVDEVSLEILRAEASSNAWD